MWDKNNFFPLMWFFSSILTMKKMTSPDIIKSEVYNLLRHVYTITNYFHCPEINVLIICKRFHFTYGTTHAWSSPSDNPRLHLLLWLFVVQIFFYKWSCTVCLSFITFISLYGITFRMVHDLLLIVHSFLALHVFLYVYTL